MQLLLVELEQLLAPRRQQGRQRQCPRVLRGSCLQSLQRLSGHCCRIC
jgi:hypothetical protein